MQNNLEYVEDFKLPNGGIYTGQCRKVTPFFVELTGKGEALYPDGQFYKGQFKCGKPYGIGQLYFDETGTSYHYGVFDDIPEGVGFQCSSFGMYFGLFSEGLMNGWGLCIHKRDVIFGWWEDGKLKCNKSDEISWVIPLYNARLNNGYKGRAIHVDIIDGIVSVMYGIAPSISNKKEGIGFRFCNDGKIIVGAEAFYYKMSGYKITGDVDVYINSERKSIKGYHWENGNPMWLRGFNNDLP